MEQIVRSFNLFIDSDRGNPNGASTGDDFQLNLNSIPIDVDKNQMLRLTVTNFSMYKSFTNVNANNSCFTLRTEVQADNSLNTNILNLSHKNYDLIRAIAQDFSDKVKDQLLIDSQAAGSAATQVEVDQLTPAAGTNVAGTTNNVISFRVQFKDSGGTLTAHNLTNVKVQFYEKCPNTQVDTDVYSLLGGNRIRYNTDTTTNSITVTEGTTSLTFKCLYPAQRHTEHYVYLRSSLTSNNLATSSLEAAHKDDLVSNVHHSNILGRFVIDTEMVQYSSNTNEYFIELTSQRHLQNMRLFLTDHHGRKLAQYAQGQNTLGNLNFNLVLRCDIIQKSAPNQRFTPDVVRTAPARFSNTYTQVDGHTRT